MDQLSSPQVRSRRHNTTEPTRLSGNTSGSPWSFSILARMRRNVCWGPLSRMVPLSPQMTVSCSNRSAACSCMQWGAVRARQSPGSAAHACSYRIEGNLVPEAVDVPFPGEIDRGVLEWSDGVPRSGERRLEIGDELLKGCSLGPDLYQGLQG